MGFRALIFSVAALWMSTALLASRDREVSCRNPLADISAHKEREAQMAEKAREAIDGRAESSASFSLVDPLERLEKVNQELKEAQILLADSKLRERRSYLEDRGVIVKGSEEVFRPDYSNGTETPQQMPFSELLLPIAHTGIYIPNKQVSDEHLGIFILFPGAGSKASTAQTLLDIAGSFHGKKSKNRGRSRESSSNSNPLDEVGPDKKKFRLATFPADLPLNGMGENAPFQFASEEAVVQVVRHIQLVLEILHPGLPVFVGGRSQGALISLLYSQHFADVAGVIALNPSHPDREIFNYSVEKVEGTDIQAILPGVPGLAIHEKSWDAYKEFTPRMDLDGLSRAPALILYGNQDESYPRELYARRLNEYIAADPLRRSLATFDGPHNLWDRKDEVLYHHVLGVQAAFMLEQIERLKR